MADSIFDRMDVDSKGFLDAAQLRTALDRGTRTVASFVPSFDEMDGNQDGVIDRAEFNRAMAGLRGSPGGSLASTVYGGGSQMGRHAAASGGKGPASRSRSPTERVKSMSPIGKAKRSMSPSQRRLAASIALVPRF